MMRAGLVLAVALVAGGCNDTSKGEGDDVQLARGKLVGVCRYVYKDVLAVSNCEQAAMLRFDLENRYTPGRKPDQVADKVLSDLFQSDAEVQARRRAGRADQFP